MNEINYGLQSLEDKVRAFLKGTEGDESLHRHFAVRSGLNGPEVYLADPSHKNDSRTLTVRGLERLIIARIDSVRHRGVSEVDLEYVREAWESHEVLAKDLS